MIENVYRVIVALIGAIIAYLEPTIPFLLVCTFAVLCDCWSAWSLARRVRDRHPDKADGKFKSDGFGRIFVTLLKVYAITVLAYMIQEHVMTFEIGLPNIVAGAVCFWQLWSILENESSCNDAAWAKLAQKILVDKTERHFNIDLSDLKKNNHEHSN